MKNIASVFEINDLSIYDKTVLIYLRTMQEELDTVFPSYDTIASKCGMSRRKAIDVVKKLVGLGLVKKEHRYNTVDNSRKQTSNTYKTAQDAPVVDEPMHSPAPYSLDLKSLDLKQEEDNNIITDIPYYPFENEIKKHKIPNTVREAILTAIEAEGGDIWEYSLEAIRRALKKAVNRMRIGSGLYNPSKWIASAIRNEQLNLDMNLDMSLSPIA